MFTPLRADRGSDRTAALLAHAGPVLARCRSCRGSHDPEPERPQLVIDRDTRLEIELVELVAERHLEPRRPWSPRQLDADTRSGHDRENDASSWIHDQPTALHASPDAERTWSGDLWIRGPIVDERGVATTRPRGGSRLSAAVHASSLRRLRPESVMAVVPSRPGVLRG